MADSGGLLGSDPAKRRAARVVNLGDAWSTVPGAILLLLNGLAMVAARYGGVAAFTTTGWITAGLVLLAYGIIWAFRLVPAQLTLYRLARVDGPLDVEAFRASSTAGICGASLRQPCRCSPSSS